MSRLTSRTIIDGWADFSIENAACGNVSVRNGFLFSYELCIGGANRSLIHIRNSTKTTNKHISYACRVLNDRGQYFWEVENPAARTEAELLFNLACLHEVGMTHGNAIQKYLKRKGLSIQMAKHSAAAYVQHIIMLENYLRYFFHNVRAKVPDRYNMPSLKKLLTPEERAIFALEFPNTAINMDIELIANRIMPRQKERLDYSNIHTF